jgi:hypothetical protein
MKKWRMGERGRNKISVAEVWKKPGARSLTYRTLFTNPIL